MATFEEFMKVAEISIKDKTSHKRMNEIVRIMRQYKVLHGLTPEQAVEVLQALGPTYVKIGQLASNRSDLLPKAYCDAFEKLRDDANPMPFDVVIEQIDRAYGKSWHEVFASIDPVPLGAASIAQVHKATLLDGTTVAVKVRRPGVAESMAEDIMLMKLVGVNPIIVHGGGKAITEAMEQRQLDVRFVEGQRVTTDDTMEVVRTVLTGKVNQELVAAINAHGNLAVGVSGADAGTIIASQADIRLGRVGKVERINSQLLEDLVAGDFIPVLATVGIGEDGGFYNVNADVVAGHVAAAIGAHKVVFLTDVDGLYEDFSDKDSLVSRMTLEEAKGLVEGGKLASGMVPKMRSCTRWNRACIGRTSSTAPRRMRFCSSCSPTRASAR